MNKSFKFNYYGLQCKVKSKSSLFLKIIANKLNGFAQYNTYKLLNEKITINFSLSKKYPHNLKAAKIISDQIQLGPDYLLKKHYYLASISNILFSFKKKKLNQINIYFHQGLIFKLLNFLSLNKLKQQLFSNLIKLYIEQSLLYYLCQQKKLSCLHAAAVQKKQQAYVLVGNNGVGKSTLAQYLIAKADYQFIADNYLLIDQNYAYFSPDSIRLSAKSLNFLNQQAREEFGFGKKISQLKNKHLTHLKKIAIKNIYLITRGKNWQSQKINLNEAKNIIEKWQITNQEDIRFATLANYYIGKKLDFNLTKNQYIKLTVPEMIKLKHYKDYL